MIALAIVDIAGSSEYARSPHIKYKTSDLQNQKFFILNLIIVNLKMIKQIRTTCENKVYLYEMI